MGWSGGTFTRSHDWTADEAGAIDIEASRMDQEDDNFESGINNCLTKDGQNSPTTNLPMGTNRHTGVGNAQALTDYASAADVIDQHLTHYVDTGAANAYVITPSPAISAYAEGQKFSIRIANANTGASTLNVNGIAAEAIQNPDGSALTSGQLALNGIYEVVYRSGEWVLVSPDSIDKAPEARTITSGAGLTGGGDLSANRTLAVGAGTGITVNADDVQTNDSEIVHDNLSGFVANEHIDHSGVSITAGTGLTGGGTIAATRTINVVGADGIVANANDVSLDVSSLTEQTGLQVSVDFIPMYDASAGDHKRISIEDLNAAAGDAVPTSRTVNAGSGLTGGGDLSANRTFNIGAGTGITVAADAISTNDSAIVHDSLSGFVADEHIAHSGVSINAGSGLTGGGSIAASRTVNVGAGTGISVAADSVGLDTSNTRNSDHGSISVTAGSGLTGGGTIAATRTLNVGAGSGIAVAADSVALDISGLTALEGNAIASSDGYLVDDAGTPKRVEHTDAGVPVSTVTGITDTLATADMNRFIEYTNASAVTVTLNTGVGKIGNFVIIKQSGAGQVTVSGTATFESSVSESTRIQHSVITLFCIAANTWAVYGDMG